MQLDTATQVQDAYKPQSQSEYRGAFLHHLQRNNRKELPQLEPIYAGIDQGRWVVPCEHCGSGIAFHPQWQFAACFLCGRSWTKVIFPDAAMMQQLESIFLLRPVERQLRGMPPPNQRRYWSWRPWETIADLIAENQKYDWPVPKGVA